MSQESANQQHTTVETVHAPIFIIGVGGPQPGVTYKSVHWPVIFAATADDANRILDHWIEMQKQR